jgi:uncharacterized protein (DUF2236 family)
LPVVSSLFAADSAIRRIGSESVLMLGGGRALLMQVAHPVVARAVHEHSHYATEPWRRLARTMTSLYTIVLGSPEEAQRAGDVTRAVHARVPGADDPDAQLWVHATLVDTGLTMYEAFVGRLRERDRGAFYDEMKLVAEVFGVPRSILPPHYGAFVDYERKMLARLRVGDDARAVARTVLAPPLPSGLRPFLPALQLVTVGLLPERLRCQYGLRWTLAHRVALALQKQSVRTLLPATPSLLRELEPERTLPMRLLAAFAR